MTWTGPRRYYTVDTLKDELRAYEEQWGMTTAEFREGYHRDEKPDGLCWFDAFVWNATAEMIEEDFGHSQPESNEQSKAGPK